MKKFGLETHVLNELIAIFDKYLHPFQSAKIWLFGSRAKGNYKQNSDIDLLLTCRSKKIKESLPLLRNALDDSKIPYLIDLVQSEDLAKNYVKEVNATKLPLWSSAEVKILSPWRKCPLGYHWVKRHDRKKSKIEDVDGHCRKNALKKDLLSIDEIISMPENNLFNNPKDKIAPVDLGFSAKSFMFDSLIEGWTFYWNETLKPNEPLHPNHVKSLIATESSFNENATAKNSPKIGDAIGLMQITKDSRRNLANQKELKDHLIIIEDQDLYNPTINICAGIRWLFRKKELADRNLKRNATWEEAMWNYKGILRSNSNLSKKSKTILKNYLIKLQGKK